VFCGQGEDVLELILNLKEVTFKGSAIKKNKKPKRLNLTFAQSLCSHTI
jgi:DNA-directed RNA polymerase alpha subunit